MLDSAIGDPGGTGIQPRFHNWGSGGYRDPALIPQLGIRGVPGSGLDYTTGDPGGTGIRPRFHYRGSRGIRDPTFRSLVPTPDLSTLMNPQKLVC